MQTFEQTEPGNLQEHVRVLRGNDGCKHFLRSWNASKARAQVLYLHGIEGHSLWIGETANFLQSEGISVHAMDRRGSGLSEELRGDTKHYSLLLDDCEFVLSSLRNERPDLPLFLMANCWGAKLAAIICAKQASASGTKLVDGLILSSPAIQVKVDLTFPQKLVVALRFLTGNLSPLDIPLTPEDFTDNPYYLDFIQNDKMRLLEASPRFYVGNQILGFLAKNAASKIELPTLILQAGTDTIVHHEGVRNWYQRLASKEKSLKIFEGIYHSLDFHSEPTEYRAILLDWIEKQILKRGSEG